MDYGSGQLLTFQTTSDKIDDLQDFLDFLPDNHMDIALLKRLGIGGKEGSGIHSTKYEWRQTELRPREETVTLADGSVTAITVADSGIYQIGEIVRCENEFMRITALADATTLTVVRGYGASSGAAHSSKLMFSVGKAAVENATPGDAVFDTPAELYNYIQTFDVPVDVSHDQMMSMTVAGNTLDDQLERRFTEINRQLARAVIYGQRDRNATDKIHTMGGLKSFLSTNPTSAGGALSKALIDAEILQIVNNGGMPKILAMSPYQKQKLDALDNNLQNLGKRERTGGGLITNTWQSGVLNYELDVIVDRTILTDELYIIDPEMVEIAPFTGNGMSGAWGTYDATAVGQDGVKKIIRGKYGLKVHNEKAHSYLYALT